MDLQELVDRAWSLKQKGERTEALKLYSETYDQLIRESTEYARGFEGLEIDEGKTRKVMPQFFNKADEYLKRDDLACIILNNMGVIFAELGDKQTADKYFKESIKYTPDGLNYQNPKIGLKELEE